MNLQVTITNEDNKNKGQYTDGKNCILATALKRQFQTDDVKVGVIDFILNGNTYLIPYEVKEEFHNSYYPHYPFKEITFEAVRV